MNDKKKTHVLNYKIINKMINEKHWKTHYELRMKKVKKEQQNIMI